MSSPWLAVCEEESFTCAVNWKVPVWFGVPLMVPVELFSWSPGGSEPCDMLH